MVEPETAAACYREAVERPIGPLPPAFDYRPGSRVSSRMEMIILT